ncbi:uncharacterized protein LOC129590765 [Paramacrobiotus metropolitanus]|uniref:uncharacterized protein LOC129590765 n=1 Tax=Paramacrobiotus metropolitanus TaxID=2943436 RepID=UPI002445CA5C|nr:uncharacterized protein LOC129590765 [Paramacrobiotus metropolitanus]
MMIFIQSCLFLGLLYSVQGKSCGCGVSPASSNGSDATALSRTGCSQVAIQNDVGSIFCSAVLIDELYAITPGQCIFGRQANSTFIRIGSTDSSNSSVRVLAVDDLFVHQEYLNINTRNDYNIGIIKLQQPIDCSSGSVCLACLPPRSSLNITNPNCAATTWNVRANAAAGVKNTSSTLQSRPASIMDQIDCVNKLREDQAIQNDYRLSDNKFCLHESENTTTCTGDLGDPLICLDNNQYEVVGLNTLGFSCFRKSLPSFYVRVSAFVDWISKVMERQPPASHIGTMIMDPLVGPVVLLPSAPTNPQSSGFVIPKETPRTSPQMNTTTTQTNTTTDSARSELEKSPNATQQVLVTPPHNVTATNTNQTSLTNTSETNTNTPTLQAPVVIFPHGTAGTALNQTNGASGQHIAADGSLEQVGRDGSVQRQHAITQDKLLKEVSPNVFQANIGGQAINLDMNTGPKIIFPTADVFFGNNPIRQKRDLLGNLGSSFSVPIINIPESDATYDRDSGRFVFRLPNRTTAVSSASFLPTTAEDIKQQIIAQQDRILAQIDNYKKNILVSLNGVFNNNNSPNFDNGNFANTDNAAAASTGMSGVATSSNAGTIPKPVERAPVPISRVSQNANSDTSSSGTTKPPWKSIYGKKTTDTDSGSGATGSTSIKSKPVPTNSRIGGRGPALAQGIAVANGNSAGTSSNSDSVDTSLDSDNPAEGSVNTSLNGATGGSSAGVSFKGDRVLAQTKNTANSASASVSASSSG